MPSDWRQILADTLHGRVALLCVGNPLRADDGAGPALARRLDVADPWRVFDCGVAPENWIGPVCAFHPDVALLVDAIDFAAPPGTLRCWPADALADVGVSTHHASPSLTVQIITEDAGAEAMVVGIQPLSAALSGEMCEPVAAAVRELAAELERLWRARTAPG